MQQDHSSSTRAFVWNISAFSNNEERLALNNLIESTPPEQSYVSRMVNLALLTTSTPSISVLSSSGTITGCVSNTGPDENSAWFGLTRCFPFSPLKISPVESPFALASRLARVFFALVCTRRSLMNKSATAGKESVECLG